MLPPMVAVFSPGSGGIEEPVLPGLGLHVLEQGPGLHGHRARLLVHGADAVHAPDGEHHAAPYGHRAAGAPCAGPADGHRHPVGAADLQHLGDLLCARRFTDGFRGVGLGSRQFIMAEVGAYLLAREDGQARYLL